VVISGFEWDDDNIFHVERHEFTPEEVEEVFAGDHKIRRVGLLINFNVELLRNGIHRRVLGLEE